MTGTLLTGRLAQDDALVREPSGRTVKVRGLHVHGETQDAVLAGQRVAVNLAGVDVAGRAWRNTDAHGRRDRDSSRRRRHRAPANGASTQTRGTSPIPPGDARAARTVVLPGSAELEPGSSAPARIHLAAPAVLVRGDRFILRAYSPLETMAGGTILDPHPPRRGVRTAAALARFSRIARSESDAVMVMIDEAGLSGLPVSQLTRPRRCRVG